MRTLLRGALSLLVAGCAGTVVSPGDDAQAPVPQMLALSASRVAIGQPLQFFGSQFLHDKQGRTDVRFKGVFRAVSGQVSNVDFRSRPRWIDGNTLEWGNFGPFQVPFGSAGNQIGTFSGQLTAINVADGVAESESQAVAAELEIRPSLVIRELQPTRASCNQPVKRFIEGYPYRITTEAVGFQPKAITYTIAGEPGISTARRYSQVVSSQVNTFGQNGELTFAMVPVGQVLEGTNAQPKKSTGSQVFYIVDFTVTATDTQNQIHSINYKVAVHRPIEFIDIGKMVVAKVGTPYVPQGGGCKPGGLTGSTFSYTESYEETASRSIGNQWDNNWSRTHASENSGSHTDANSTNVTQGSSSEVSYHTDNQAGGSASAGFTFFLPISAQGSYTRSWGDTNSQGNSQSLGSDNSASDTESWSYSDSNVQGWSKGGQDSWSVSASKSISQNTTIQILPQMAMVLYLQQTTLRHQGLMINYNLCGEHEIAGQGWLEDFVWGYEFAQGSTCSPLPAPQQLPPSQTFIP